MVDWLKQLVVGGGNVIHERSYTNWNTFDDRAVVAEKQKEVSSQQTGAQHEEAQPASETDSTKK